MTIKEINIQELRKMDQNGVVGKVLCMIQQRRLSDSDLRLGEVSAVLNIYRLFFCKKLELERTIWSSKRDLGKK